MEIGGPFGPVASAIYLHASTCFRGSLHLSRAVRPRRKLASGYGTGDWEGVQIGCEVINIADVFAADLNSELIYYLY